MVTFCLDGLLEGATLDGLCCVRKIKLRQKGRHAEKRVLLGQEKAIMVTFCLGGFFLEGPADDGPCCVRKVKWTQ